MRIPPKPDPQPGEWQTDERGRRYRKIGNCIEYEPEINGVPQSVFLESNRRMKEQREKQIIEEQREAARLQRLRRNCPFADGMQTDCKREACALFVDGCTLARWTATKATEGLQCPFSKYHSKCRTDCALYRGGCTFTGITTNKESEDK